MHWSTALFYKILILLNRMLTLIMPETQTLTSINVCPCSFSVCISGSNEVYCIISAHSVVEPVRISSSISPSIRTYCMPIQLYTVYSATAYSKRVCVNLSAYIKLPCQAKDRKCRLQASQSYDVSFCVRFHNVIHLTTMNITWYQFVNVLDGSTTALKQEGISIQVTLSTYMKQAKYEMLKAHI